MLPPQILGPPRGGWCAPDHLVSTQFSARPRTGHSTAPHATSRLAHFPAQGNERILMFRRSVKAILRRFGYDIVKYSPANFLRVKRRDLLRSRGVTVVLDVGANVGQFGSEIREDGYEGRIVSFEPLPSAFESLLVRADDRWQCFEIAVGAEEGNAVLNVADDTWSSSLLRPNPRLELAAPRAATASTTPVTVRTLDALCRDVLQRDDRVFLKVDAQGYEREV